MGHYETGYEVDYEVAKAAVSYGDRGRRRCWRLRRRSGRRRRRSRRVAVDWKGRARSRESMVVGGGGTWVHFIAKEF